jgi:SAM-dependent methyltransferase
MATNVRHDTIGDAQRWANDRLWARRDLVKSYSSRALRPAEVVALVRHRDEFTGRVLDLGCGAGRLTGYLATLAREAVGMDVSPVMIEHCRRAYPDTRFDLGDIRDLTGYADESFDGVFAVANLFDVLEHAERLRVLGEMRRLLAPGGLLLFSSHNLANEPHLRRPTQLRMQDPARFALDVFRMPRGLVNHLRVRKFERHEDDHAYLNDISHDYMALHYYIGRDVQDKQLSETGLELLEALDAEGNTVPGGETAARSPALHYVARRPYLSARVPDRRRRAGAWGPAG